MCDFLILWGPRFARKCCPSKPRRSLLLRVIPVRSVADLLDRSKACLSMNRSVADPNASPCRRISARHPRCKLADVRATARKPVAIRDRPVPGTLCTDSLFSAGNRWCLSRVDTDEPSSRWILDRSRLLRLPVWSASPRTRRRPFSFWPAPFIVSVDQRFMRKKIDLVIYLHCCSSLNSWSIF